MFEGFERKVAAVEGLDIAYSIGGEGAPVLLLHGFPQTMASLPGGHFFVDLFPAETAVILSSFLRKQLVR
jgi:pimeloyl-ACP methyl ester carboxylesterase